MTERAASDIHVHMCIRDSSLLPDTSQPRRWPSRSVHTASRQWPDPTGGHRNGIRSHGSWARRAVLQELWGITEKTQSKQNKHSQHKSVWEFSHFVETQEEILRIHEFPQCSNNVPLRVQNTHNALGVSGNKEYFRPRDWFRMKTSMWAISHSRHTLRCLTDLTLTPSVKAVKFNMTLCGVSSAHEQMDQKALYSQYISKTSFHSILF